MCGNVFLHCFRPVMNMETTNLLYIITDLSAGSKKKNLDLVHIA